MPNLRGSGFRSHRSQRRKTSWNIGPQSGVDGAPQTLSGTNVDLATGGAVVVAEGVTLVRTRGELAMHLEVASLQDGFHGAFGIAVATSTAFTAGIGSLPTPLDEESWDGWLYHRYFSLLAGGIVAAATAATQQNQINSTSAALRFEVDSKAMRKLQVDQTIYAALQVVEFGASAQMVWSFNSRMLVKLP